MSVLLVAAAAAVFVLRRRGDAAPVKGITKGVDVNASSRSEDPNKKKIRILYGTQTGTAERFSKQLGNELRRKYGDSVAVEVIDAENYSAEDRLGNEELALFLFATYGDGEPTDNAADFYGWVCSKAEAVESGDMEAPLKLNYGVFGLGNKQYEHFNAVGKRLHAALAVLGGTPLLRAGLGDDDDDIDSDFDKWTEELVSALDARRVQLLGAGAGVGGSADAAAPAAYDVTVLPPGSRGAAPFGAGGGGARADDPMMATIAAVRELHTSASERSCVHVEIELGAGGPSYTTGDHVGVYAANSDAVVSEVAELLGLPVDTVFTLAAPPGSDLSESAPPAGGAPLALLTALQYYADVLSSPRRDALLALASVAAEPAEAERLRLLAGHDAAGKAAYAEYVSGPQRSLLEVLRDFPSARPGLGLFFGSVAPRLQPRFYSISSSSRVHPTCAHVTCAVVREQMPTGRVHEGVASTWLAAARGGERVPVFVRHSHFRLPANPASPVVMIGPGTGLAPFRAFLQERAVLLGNGAALGPSALYFGCRSRAKDFIYEEELQAAARDGVLGALHVAFSREGPSKDYVQHHMARTGAALWALLSAPGCHVYVCGDAKHMAMDVHRALAAVAEQHGGMGAAAAEQWVKALSDGGRYLKDVW